MLLGDQRHELPAEVAGRTALAEQFHDAALDAHRVVPTKVTACHRPGDLFQAGANLGDRALALLLTDLLIDTAEDEKHSARDEVVGVGIGELMMQHCEFVAFFGQGGVALASAFLFDGQVARVVPEEALAVFLKERLDITPRD